MQRWMQWTVPGMHSMQWEEPSDGGWGWLGLLLKSSHFFWINDVNDVATSRHWTIPEDWNRFPLRLHQHLP